MIPEFDPNIPRVVIGYPSYNSSFSSIPEGICIEKPDSSETVEVIPIRFNRKLINRLLVLMYFLKGYIALDILIHACWIISQNELSRFLIAMPIIGYYGCKYYHKGIVLIFNIYLLVNLFIRCLSMYFSENICIRKAALFICFNSIESVLLTLFYAGLTKATKLEREFLRNC